MDNGNTELLRISNKNYYENSEFESNNFGKFIVLNYKSNVNVTIKFVKTGFVTTTTLIQIQKGTVWDKLSPSLCGVGILGEKYKIKDCFGKFVKEYRVWRSMLTRCYSEDYIKRFPTYDKCEVSNNFKHYEYFYEWCNRQKGFNEDIWHLDKDLLIRDNKLYSEETCVFLPEILNLAIVKPKAKDLPVGVTRIMNSDKFAARISRYNITKNLGTFNDVTTAHNVYCNAKKEYIVELAETYRDKLDARAYLALIEYKV